jgi:hypothetical protein
MLREARIQAEKRAYYQLLRQLLSDEIDAAYRPDTTRTPSKLLHLLSELEGRETRVSNKT